jgi:beta-lactam-binding protein with PASTA domain
VFGASIAGPIWRDTMQAALVGVPVQPLPLADRKYIVGQTTPVPDVSGLQPSDARDVLTQAGFQPVVAPGSVKSLYPAGTVAYTSPKAGSPAAAGSTIVIHLSNGVAPPPSPSATATSPGPTVTGTPGPPPPSTSPTPGPTASKPAHRKKPR